MALFSPYDVERVYGKPFADISVTEHYDEMAGRRTHQEDPATSTPVFFTTIAELQFELATRTSCSRTRSTARTRSKAATMSNPCSEILQVQEPSAYNEDLTSAQLSGRDISCNLLRPTSPRRWMAAWLTRWRRLSAHSPRWPSTPVINAVPSIRRANEEGHAIGLGQMNLARLPGPRRHPLRLRRRPRLHRHVLHDGRLPRLPRLHALAVEHGRAFASFATSDYAHPPARATTSTSTPMVAVRSPRAPNGSVRCSGEYGIAIPDRADAGALRDAILKDGIYNQNLQAVPPTGSIWQINHSTSSIPP